MRYQYLALVWLCLSLIGCSNNTLLHLDPLPHADQSLGDISKFLSAVASSEEVQVYEGLPHQTWDRELYQSERRRSDLVWFEGYPFYAKPLDVTSDEKKALTAIALRKDSHLPLVRMKRCDGYHPDYAIVWTKDHKQSGALVCFGCGEWKNFTPEGGIYEDLGPDAYEELKAILAKYLVQRPASKAWPVGSP